ncbi:MAG TPA: septum formation initiator family protein [Verrucomicrobiae bacterium]|nr:septum formation initiator family protein [Verrucomicrobiae bacterium]
MQTKIEPYQQKAVDFLRRLSDVRFAGQVLFVVIVLLISWSGVKTIQTNYGLQKQISALRQQNDVQHLQNNNLALQNEYLNSNQYLELSARQNFGLAQPGEKEIIVPQNVALAYTVNVPDNTSDKTTAVQPAYQRNLQSWVNFFFHRQSS